jgi:AAA domain, putative AbiEii toxin, Type IV TA system
MIVQPGFTALLGANNSGKSALLRFFYEFRTLFAQLSEPHQIWHAVRSPSPMGFKRQPSYDPENIFTRQNDSRIGIDLIFDANPRTTLRLSIDRAQPVFSPDLLLDDHVLEKGRFDVNADFLIWHGNQVLNVAAACQVLRSLASTTYIPAFRNAVNAGSTEAYFDMAVGQGFVARWREYQTGTSIKNNQLIIELTEDIRHIFGFKDLRINASADAKTLQLSVNGVSYRLEDLGSGLAQFILALGSVAMNRRDFLLIDEPELNLHPSLQIDFLTTIAS